MIGPDVLASTLEALEPGWIDIFSQSHPLIEKVVKGGRAKRQSLQGYMKTFNVNAGGPGQITNITGASTPINGGRRQNLQKGSEFAHRCIYAFDVPCGDMAAASGEQDLAQLIDDYPTPAFYEFMESVAYQIGSGQAMVTGTGLDITGIQTWNGDTTYNPRGQGARTGLFEFAARSAQAATVEGLAKSGIANQGWTNGFFNISSASTQGASLVRQAYYEGSQFDRAYGKLDLMFGDTLSYQTFLDYWETQVRTTKVTLDTTPNDVNEGIPYKSAIFYNDLAIDISLATYTGGSHAALTTKGVIYGMKSKAFGLFTLGKDSMTTDGFFQWRDPIRNPFADSYRFECVADLNLFCRSLKSTFAVTGMGNP